jgi:putative addiction module CopG family antidote
MNITLAPELEKFVQAQLESGAYRSANELFGDALFLLEEHNIQRRKRTEAVNRFIDEALEDDGLIEPKVVLAKLDKIIEEARLKYV